MSAFHREEVELAKPFLICQVTEASPLSCCKALDPLQLVNIGTLASIAYSRCGRAMVKINASLDRSAKVRRTMKSNYLAVDEWGKRFQTVKYWGCLVRAIPPFRSRRKSYLYQLVHLEC